MSYQLNQPNHLPRNDEEALSMSRVMLPSRRAKESVDSRNMGAQPDWSLSFDRLDSDLWAAFNTLMADIVDSLIPDNALSKQYRHFANRDIEKSRELGRRLQIRQDTREAQGGAIVRREAKDPRIQALDELLTTPRGEVVVHAFLEVMRERADTIDHYYPNSQIAERTRNYLRSIEEDVALAYKQPLLVQRPQFVVDLRRALVESQERLNNPDTPVRSERVRSEFDRALNRLAEWM